MIKFVLRLFVVLAVGFVISNEVVDRSANYLFEPVSDAYTRESVRGQIHSLVLELSKVEPEARAAYIEKQLKPYYGLGLRVFNASDYNASDSERRIVARGDFFIRDKMQTFVAAIPGPGHQWLEVKLPPEPSFGPWVVAAVYSALGLLLCAFMLVWALPIWRDLEALKTITINAARVAGVDDRVGSIKAGKDADIAVFDKFPLHFDAHAQMVFIDGRRVV